MFLKVSDKVSRPYKTTGKVIVLCIIIFFFADDIKISQEITYPYDSWLLQLEINNIHVWCSSDYVKLTRKPESYPFVEKQTGMVFIVN